MKGIAPHGDGDGDGNGDGDPREDREFPIPIAVLMVPTKAKRKNWAVFQLGDLHDQLAFISDDNEVSRDAAAFPRFVARSDQMESNERSKLQEMNNIMNSKWQ